MNNMSLNDTKLVEHGARVNLLNFQYLPLTHEVFETAPYARLKQNLLNYDPSKHLVVFLIAQKSGKQATLIKVLLKPTPPDQTDEGESGPEAPAHADLSGNPDNIP